MAGYRSIALASVLSIPAACGARTEISRPEAIVDAYRSAIAEGEYRRAYGYLAEETRAALPYERFVEQLRRDATATSVRLRAMERTPESTTASATVAIDAETVTLVLERRGFRIVGNPADAFDQTTPRGAARAFALALSSHRADWVLALAPPSARATLDPESVERAITTENASAYAELADGLVASLDGPIETNGDLATMHVGSSRILRLVRIEGLWYVDGVD